MAGDEARRDVDDYLTRNREAWAEYARNFVDSGRRNWGADEASWGIWGIPEADVGLFPALAGREVLEVGCGTGYVSAWASKQGAAPVGIDPTWEQLRGALTFQREFDRRFPLVMAAGEALPFRDESFDVVLSEYGAAIWSDPYRWIPEAARVLRPGGDLMFLVNATLLMLCAPDEDGVPASDRLLRDYFGMHRFEWSDAPEIEFHLGYGDWVRLLRANGLEVVDLVELRPPEGATTEYDYVTNEWARRWPSEEAWKARKSIRG